MVNWKVRAKNVNFWITLIPAVILLVQTLLTIFGIDLNFEGLGEKLINFVDALFVVMALLGIVNDPTTAGYSDSTQAMTYEEPKVSH